MMQKNAEEYLEMLAEDWLKENLLEIRQMTLDYALELEEIFR